MDEPKKDEFKYYRSYTYNDAVVLVQRELEHVERIYGKLKTWCEENDMQYNTIVSLKNGNLSFEAPKLILKLLIALGFDAKMVTDTISTGKGRKDFEEKTSYVLRRVDTQST